MFVVFEGIDCSGKSTQITRLSSYLKSKNISVIATKEPGGTDIGERIRSIVKYNPSNEHISPKTELLLFNAARSTLIDNIIKPNLDKNTVVLLDRYYYSTLAYQGGGNELDNDFVEYICNFVNSSLKQPDIIFYLDISYEEHRRRKFNRNVSDNATLDRIENNNKEFYKRVLNKYNEILNNLEHTRVVKIDGTLPEREITKIIIDAYENKLV
jgi:dTMP kinase